MVEEISPAVAAVVVTAVVVVVEEEEEEEEAAVVTEVVVDMTEEVEGKVVVAAVVIAVVVDMMAEAEDKVVAVFVEEVEEVMVLGDAVAVDAVAVDAVGGAVTMALSSSSEPFMPVCEAEMLTSTQPNELDSSARRVRHDTGESMDRVTRLSSWPTHCQDGQDGGLWRRIRVRRRISLRQYVPRPARLWIQRHWGHSVGKLFQDEGPGGLALQVQPHSCSA